MDSKTTKSALPRPNSHRSAQDDVIINTILPSYHMFEATVSKKLVPNEESFKEDPPQYELSPLNLAGITPVSSALDLTEVTRAPPNGPVVGELVDGTDPDVFNQKSADFWNKTVLANVHNLRSLHNHNNSVALLLQVQVVFTESICEIGVPPVVIDPSHTEYAQGDYLHGYVTLCNTSAMPIPFDMVYVAFEGIMCVTDQLGVSHEHAARPIVYKFLNMLDLFASWSYANIDRLVTDSGNPHDWCEGQTDPVDNTILAISAKRTFQPGQTYKRFFLFRVPERLLDDTCDVKSLDVHCAVPPSLGRAYSLNKTPFSISPAYLKDFAPLRSFVAYLASARAIGRASQYGIEAEQDEYVLAAERFVQVRVVPYLAQNIFPGAHSAHAYEVRAAHMELCRQAQAKIKQGQLIAESSRDAQNLAAFVPLSSKALRTSLSLLNDKMRQLYVSPSRDSKLGKSALHKLYQHVSRFLKKGFTGTVKAAFSMYLSTPQTTLHAAYVPPTAFRAAGNAYSTRLRLPVDLTCVHESGSMTFPAIKNISAELVVLTVTSRKHEIPLEFDPEMCFDAEIVDDSGLRLTDDLATFESKTVRPFQVYYKTLVALMKRIGVTDSAFRVEKRLFKDIKSMASLNTKRVSLPLARVSVRENVDGTWVPCVDLLSMAYTAAPSPTCADHTAYTKQLEVEVDLHDCRLKSGNGVGGDHALCLVPDFQLCFMARLYYLRLFVRYKHGVTQVLQVPVTIHA